MIVSYRYWFRSLLCVLFLCFPSRYHKPDNSSVCPFGARCFYAHLDAHGNDVKDRPTPPPPQGAPRRSCPYLRVGGARGGGRGGGGGGAGHRGMGHGGGRESFDNLRQLYSFNFEGETGLGGVCEYTVDEPSIFYVTIPMSADLRTMMCGKIISVG